MNDSVDIRLSGTGMIRSLMTGSLLLTLVLLVSCSGTAPRQEGSATFRIALSAPAGTAGKAVEAPAFDICADYGVETVSAKFVNGSGDISAQGSWSCSAHQGTVSGIPARSGYTILVEGFLADSSIGWSGTTNNVTITADAVTDVGTVSVNYAGTDQVNPAVVSVTPPAKGTSVPVAGAVTVVFSEKMAPSTLSDSNITVSSDAGNVSGTITYDPAVFSVRFQPGANLSYNTVYTVTVAQNVRDLAGHSLDDVFTWTFTTEAQPAVVPKTSPAAAGESKAGL